jgi:hypothetical protein
MVAFRMWSKETMLFLWCVALSAMVVVATQSAARTWMAYCWVAVCSALAISSTILHKVERKRQRRWEAGDYD